MWRGVATQVRTHRTHGTQKIGRLRQDAMPADQTQDLFLLMLKTTHNTTGREIPLPGRHHPPDVSRLVPLTRIPHGRPAKKRKGLGDHRSGIPSIGEDIMSKAPPRCSTCGKVGHYARTCQQSHI